MNQLNQVLGDKKVNSSSTLGYTVYFYLLTLVRFTFTKEQLLLRQILYSVLTYFSYKTAVFMINAVETLCWVSELI